MSMTLERAAEILDPKHREHYESIEIVNEACEIGRNAILRQTPKKVIPFCSGSPVAMACPECGTFQDFADRETLDNRSEYCYKCGQALDWSDE